MNSPLNNYYLLNTTPSSQSDLTPTTSSNKILRSKSLSSISSISIKTCDETDWTLKLSVLKKLFNSTHKPQVQVPNDLNPTSLIFITTLSIKSDTQRRNSYHSVCLSSLLSLTPFIKASSSSPLSFGTPLIQQTLANASNTSTDSTNTILMSRSGTVSFKDHTSLGHYRIIKTIGTGAFSTVKLAIDLKTDKKVALKLISKSMIAQNASMEESVENEINLMKVMNMYTSLINIQICQSLLISSHVSSHV